MADTILPPGENFVTEFPQAAGEQGERQESPLPVGEVEDKAVPTNPAPPAGGNATQTEAPVVEEIEEELIIEDFTIDGICGVY